MVITMAKLRMAQLAHASRLGQKKERLNDGNNNCQATHGARQHQGISQLAPLCLNNISEAVVLHSSFADNYADFQVQGHVD